MTQIISGKFHALALGLNRAKDAVSLDELEPIVL